MPTKIPDLVAIDRILGERSLRDFTRLAWPIVEPGQPFSDSWHIGLLCEHYEACLRGEISRLVVNVPPGMSKSRLTCVFFPTWAWLQDPSLRWIFASFDIGLTTRDAGDSVELIQSRWFRDRWGDRVVLPTSVPVREIENLSSGWRLATSIGSRATGWHANGQIIDDPIKPRNITRNALEDAGHWLQNTMASRWRKPGVNFRILIMQRVHSDDPAARMLADGAVHVNLPMRYEPQVRCETRWGADERTAEGELLCPERYGEDDVKTLEREMGGLVAAAQLQQRPVPDGGSVFRAEWLTRRWSTLPEKFDQTVSSWDMAFKGTEGSDYVVGQLWGRKGTDYYLIDQVRGRMSFSQTLDAFRAFSKKWPKTLGKLVEDKANGPAVVDTLKKEVPGIVEVNPEGGKEARANAVSPLFEAGNVILPETEWLTLDYLPELMAFPMGRHDDQVDATTQALLYLHKGRSYLTDAMSRLRKTGL